MTAVNGGTLLLSIAGDRTLHLEGLVDENEIPRVAIDQPARIRTEAYPDRVFEGRVRQITASRTSALSRRGTRRIRCHSCLALAQCDVDRL